MDWTHNSRRSRDGSSCPTASTTRGRWRGTGGRPDFAGLQDASPRQDPAWSFIFFRLRRLLPRARICANCSLPTERRAAGDLEARQPRDACATSDTSSRGDACCSRLRRTLEGIISKRIDAPYRSGKGGDWTKAKCRGGQEVVIGGWTSNDGGGFRSLIAGVYRDGRLVHVGRVGTGFGRDKVEQLLPRLKAAASDTSPFEITRREGGQLHGSARVCRVESPAGPAPAPHPPGKLKRREDSRQGDRRERGVAACRRDREAAPKATRAKPARSRP